AILLDQRDRARPTLSFGAALFGPCVTLFAEPVQQRRVGIDVASDDFAAVQGEVDRVHVSVDSEQRGSRAQRATWPTSDTCAARRNCTSIRRRGASQARRRPGSPQGPRARVATSGETGY